MDFLPWKDHKAYTLGAELEIRLHEARSMRLLNVSKEAHAALPLEIQPFIHHEYLDSLLELVTPVCTSPYEARASLESLASSIVKVGEKLGFVPATSGAHALPSDGVRLADDPRYATISREYGILLQNFNICGLHVHVALTSSDDALRAYNYMIEQLPVFMALSANSAYFDGNDTGLLSYRPKIFEQLPRAGMPQYFDEYYEMGEVYDALYQAEIIESIKDIWWDLRINPDFGTLELRACDASNDFLRHELLMVLYQGMCMYAQVARPEFLYQQILLQNRWNALRHGLDGIFQNKNYIGTIKGYAKTMIDKMDKAGIFEALGTRHSIDKLYQLLEHPTPAQLQRQYFETNRCLAEVERRGILK